MFFSWKGLEAFISCNISTTFSPPIDPPIDHWRSKGESHTNESAEEQQTSSHPSFSTNQKLSYSCGEVHNGLLPIIHNNFFSLSARYLQLTLTFENSVVLHFQQTLSIVVVGASGDLAKKKTYPSLLDLFEDNLLPEYTVIWGYARSVKTHQELRDHLYPHLIKRGASEIVVKDFLEKCFYHSGKSYGDTDAIAEMVGNISKYEAQSPSAACNRLFYLAIPPNV